MKAYCTSNLLRAYLHALSLLLLLHLPLSASAQNLPLPQKKFHPGRILVQPRQGVKQQNLAAHSSRPGQLRKLKSISPRSGLQLMDLLPGETVQEAILKFRKSGLVTFAEPDYLIKLHALPNDPEFNNGNLWAFRNTGQSGGVPNSDISALPAWDTLSSASDLIVAIIDTGVRYTHEDLAANMWVNPGEIPGNQRDDDLNGFIDDIHGINAVHDSGDPIDLSGHGTHVAGILGAVGNNGKGVCGVAWNIKIMAIAFFDDSGLAATSDAIQSIDYAINNGAKIINASWGSDEFSLSLQNTLEKARNAGVIIVTSAGNDTSDNDLFPVYPANYDLDNIVVVAGTNRRDQLDLAYSNFGAETVDLAAPGSMIYSTWANWDGSYLYLSGTSMATPFVSGALALLKARFPEEAERALIERLYAATDPLESLRGYCKTAGRLNLSKVLNSPLLPYFDPSSYHGFFPFDLSFTNKTFGDYSALLWDFGDGNFSTDPNPSHQFGPGTFRVTLSVTNASGFSSSFSRTIDSRPGYSFSRPRENWVPASDVNISLGDNSVSPPIPLPFAFTFFGRPYTQIYVSANGLAGFRQSNLGTSLLTPLSSLGEPNALIAPYWDDLDPSAGGSVTYATRGLAPNRQFIVSWTSVRKVGTNLDFTFQLILEENSGEILFNYSKVNSHHSSGGGRQARIGLETENGALAVPFAQLGQPRIIEDGDSIRFTPSRTGFLQVTKPSQNWFQLPTGDSLSLPPLEFELINTGAGPVDWAIQNVPDWITLTSLSGALLPGSSIKIDLTLNQSASTLPLGLAEATLDFQNTTTSFGSTAWKLQLELFQSPRLSASVSGGELQFLFDASAGRSYVTEFSLDLLQWNPIQTNTFPASGQVLLAAPLGQPFGFFRLRQQ